MNTSIKGQKKEKVCADELLAETHGRLLFRSQRMRFGRIDFGPFDVVVATQDREYRISCTHAGHGHDKERAEAIAEYMNACLGPEMRFYISCQLWVWYPPRWRGRGKAKHFEKSHWDKTVYS